MAITINWGTKTINVSQADLTPVVSGLVYELDLDVFRLALKALEASEEGMPELDTHRHNTEVIVAGTTLARVIEIINGYTVTFEDGQYAVNLVGANSNVSEVTNVNQVSLRSFNTAGLQTVSTGSGLSSAQNDELFALRTVIPVNTWEELIAPHLTSTGSAADKLEEAASVKDDVAALPTSIPVNVWNALKASYTDPTKMGGMLGEIYDTTPTGGVLYSRPPDQLTPVIKDTDVIMMAYMVLRSDHKTPASGGFTPTVTISKGGQAWQTVSRTVTEMGNGWYRVDLTSSDTDTLGTLVVRLVEGSLDETSQSFYVEARPDNRPGVVSAVDPVLITRTNIPTNLTEPEDDHWKDSFIRFTSGDLKGQVRFVTAYRAANSTLTVESLSSPPDNGDRFVLVNA